MLSACMSLLNCYSCGHYADTSAATTENCTNSCVWKQSTATLNTGGWRLGVVVSVVGRINKVNEHRARLVHDG